MRQINVLMLVIGVLAACGAPPPVNHHSSNTPNSQPTAGRTASDTAGMPPALRSLFDDDLAFAVSQESVTAAPISLVTPDGIALKLSTLKAKTVVQGPLAFTELRMSFLNPQPRTIEARFAIRLPSGASVSRFAMRIGKDFQEGEMVEKQRARQIYENFLHKRVDPALMERGAGNEFTARVFPITAGETKDLIISYSQELTGREPLVALRGLPELDQMEVELTKGAGHQPARWVKAKYTPKEDVRLAVQPRASSAVRNGELVAVRVTAKVAQTPQPLKQALFLVDTSASRGLGLSEQILRVNQMVSRIAEHHGQATKVSVAAFDQQIFEVYTGTAGGLTEATLMPLLERRALGASNVAAAMKWARRHCDEHGFTRVVLLGDGVATAGARGKKLLAAIRALRKAKVERLDVLSFGGIVDDEAAASWVTAGLLHDGKVLPGKELSNSWKRLNRSVRAELPIEVEGARWFAPKRWVGVQSGDSTIVYAEMEPGAVPRVLLGKQPLTDLHFEQVARPLLARSWAQAKIRSLLEVQRRRGDTPARRSEVVRLSRKYRVLSPYTGLLVLETQADYDRYRLNRDALADILAVTQGKLTVVQRPAPQTARPAKGNMWGDSVGQSFGAGGLGLSGIGEGGGGRADAVGLGSVGTIGRGVGTGTGAGFGAGSGRLGSSRAAAPAMRPARKVARAPRVRMGSTSVSGRLPPEVIRRIVRQNFGRFRLCYSRALSKDPTIGGRVASQFSIERNGTVGSVTTTGPFPEATLSCMAAAFKNLRFPQPEGGLVTVVYPVMFSPEDGSTPARTYPTRTATIAAPPRPPQPDSSRSTFRPNRPGAGLAARAGLAGRARRSAPANDVPHAARPYEGQFAEVMELLASGKADKALREALDWQAHKPADLPALLALGEAWEANGQLAQAERAYGSLIDMYPSRADMRRYAGQRLDRIASKSARALAVDTYRKARKQRPDHPTSHRLLAYALLRQGKHRRAFRALERGLDKARFRDTGVRKVFAKDLGLVAAGWIAAAPQLRTQVMALLRSRRVALAIKPSVSFVLSWETDANDVDLHVYDSHGRHGFHGRPQWGDGASLSSDVTTGYGPEMFSVPGTRTTAGYLVQVHYYARGAMGYGMGKVQIIEHDGAGKLTIEDRPFLVMRDRAYVNVGTLGNWQQPHADEPSMR